MLHPQYFREGSTIELPELARFVPHELSLFQVLGVHAGGMGICIQLCHCETGKQFALKSVRPDYIGDQSAVDRFFDELKVWLSASMCSFVAEAIAVVRINESPCVLSTWMAKGDLAYVLPRLTSSQKFECLVRVIRGLSWVSENLGVIHRDLKPANILLDKDFLAYVGDWGLARAVGHIMATVRTSLDSGDFTRLDRTHPGSFVGTITYAAPEQILGASNVDHRADIYALGCMMFEFETGSPPFAGKTSADIARQHLEFPPRRLGGLFNPTELGLEDVIAKCLSKRPEARYATYRELDEEVTALAERHGISLNRCIVATRYQRTQLGKGHSHQDVVLEEQAVKGSKGLAIVEFADVFPFLEEAGNLMELGRYNEAEKLLRPHYVSEALDTKNEWFYPHAIALNYALCLLRLGRLDDSIAILERLESHKSKPAEFYANYSLALLHMQRWPSAIAVCERGLRMFPDDLDIQGNLTIALGNCGRLDDAQGSALKRLQLRRDVHSLEEAAGVLQRQAETKRDNNLPESVATAKLAMDLVKEGISLNPRHYALQVKHIQLRRFAFSQVVAIDLCKAMINSEECPTSYRHIAYAESIEIMAESELFDVALDHLRKIGDLSHMMLSVRNRLLATRMRILARQYMVGKYNENGERCVISEVCDFFLPTKPENLYPDPVIAAEVLEWLGRPEDAHSLLRHHLGKQPDDWAGAKAMALLRLRMGEATDAMNFAEKLSATAPWRAESYDCLGYVARQLNKLDIAQQAERHGNEIFQKEEALFKELRAHMDA
jgi:serine/threonine protein kinase/predicted Zn-dependent protease